MEYGYTETVHRVNVDRALKDQPTRVMRAHIQFVTTSDINTGDYLHLDGYSIEKDDVIFLYVNGLLQYEGNGSDFVVSGYRILILNKIREKSNVQAIIYKRDI